MNNKLLSCLIAGALSATLALAPPAFARGGGGGGGGHGGGMGGGMHASGMGGGMRGGGMGGGMHFAAMGGGAHFAGPHFAHVGRFGFRDRDHFHHRFHRFAFFGAPYAYASYDSCWRRVWTPYGLQWANVCGDYGY
jgi:hypothetical protein